ncbi:MAG TPA: aromatic hydrocarbon degradation protein, partial [Desulfobacterales bacterium]|nr:aromatic hydrocarbon degradation protein [Desulfobacterales bacterium]
MGKRLVAAVGFAAMLAAGAAWGSAFRIPEQSVNSVGRAGAYGALPEGADASYYNPAAMSWLAEGWRTEVSLLYIDLPSVAYTDAAAAANNGSSKDEQFLLPNVHLVSPAHGRWRFGLSIVYPFGLSKRWEQPLPRSTAEDFTLKTYEANPTVSYQVNDSLAIGVGLRLIYAEGEVRSQATLAGPTTLRRDLEGDATEIGWNAALSFRASERLALALTYRSQVDLDLAGDARLVLNAPVYTGHAEVTVATPDVLTLSGRYAWGDTAVEFTWDRTFWSAYDQLDFNYSVALTTISPFLAGFDNPLPKN